MMNQIETPATPAKTSAKTSANAPGAPPERRGAKSGDDAPGRFADHLRGLTTGGKHPAPGEPRTAEASPAAAGTSSATERVQRLAATFEGLRLGGAQRPGSAPAEETGSASEAKGVRDAEQDPAAMLRLALRAEWAGEEAQPALASDAQTLALTGRGPGGAIASNVDSTAANDDGNPSRMAHRDASAATPGDIHLATDDAPARREPLRAKVLHQATHFAPIGEGIRQGSGSGRGLGAWSGAWPGAGMGAASPQAPTQAQPATAGVAAPSLGIANLQSLAGAVTEAARDDGSFRNAAESGARPEAPRPGGPLRTLTIQLTPISLGKVTVEMRLVDGAMRVDITVADSRALEMVRAERDSILALVRSAGVTPESVTIQSADPAQAGRQHGPGSGNGGAPGGFEGGESDRGDARRDDAPSGGEIAGERGRAGDEASDGAPGGARGGGRDIYL